MLSTRVSIAPVVLAFVATLGGGAAAHRLLPNDGTHVDADSALVVEDVTISQVAYHDVTEDAPQLWLTFEASEGQDVYMQLGVPVLERLEDYRPALALIGPGLPEPTAELPFDPPEQMGVIVFESEGVEPRYFLEHFTGTESWIMLEEERPMPETGRYYLVGFDPDGEPGKLWVSVGRKEQFGVRDVLTIFSVVSEVRDFHETSGAPYPLLWFMGVAMILGGVILVKLILTVLTL